jgi:predicted component of type VI protein secretion system
VPGVAVVPANKPFPASLYDDSMPLKLVVSNVSLADAPQTYLFDDDRITIGRDEAVHVTLSDNKRVVSTRHAELVRENDQFFLADLRSKNFTYLNGERLESDRKYPVKDGDRFKIGDFEISLSITETVPFEADRTVFLTNPFDEPVRQLASVLDKLATAYENEPPQRGLEAMKLSLLQTIDGKPSAKMLPMLQSLLSDSSLPPSVRATPTQKPLTPLAPSARSTRIMNELSDAVARLAYIPNRFKHEFIGHTIVTTDSSKFLHAEDGTVLRDHLLDPLADDAEFQSRLDMLSAAADEVAAHQVAMMEGYKASVQRGTTDLLNAVDPERVAADLGGKSWLMKALPFLASSEIVKALQRIVVELRADDWSVAERRVFRPAFIKAYLSTLSSLVRPKLKDDTSS